MANYIPSPRDWVREQVELYESSGGTEGTTLRDKVEAFLKADAELWGRVIKEAGIAPQD
jgi:hypothetical protein